MAERRSRQWWERTIKRWRRSELTAQVFAEREGLALSTLRWWSSELGRGTRAKRESAKTRSPRPLEVRVEHATTVPPLATAIEVESCGVVVRLPGGTDAAYVASLVRALGAAD